MDNLKLISRIMRFHRRCFDCESDCIEIENKHCTIISDVHMIDEDGKVSIMKKDLARKEAAAERCYFCDYLRKLKKEVE